MKHENSHNFSPINSKKIQICIGKKKENMIGNIVRLDNFGFKTFSNQFLFHL